MCVKIKQCKDCKEVLELNTDNFRFAKDKRKKSGGRYRSRCWTCENKARDKDKVKQWHIKNKEHREKYLREWSEVKKQTTPACLSIKKPKKCKKCNGFTMSKSNCSTCKQNRIKESKRRMLLKKRITKIKNYYKHLERVTKDCVVCGMEYIHTPKHDGTGNKTCSFKCQDINAKRQRRKDNHKRRAAYAMHDMFLNKTKMSMYKEQGGKCAHCNEVMNFNHTYNMRDAEVDHIIPVSKGGLHWDVNLQLLCKGCNMKKNNILIIRQLPAHAHTP